MIVYFLEAVGANRIKIGCASLRTVAGRIQAIHTSCPFEVKLIGITRSHREKALHKKFAHLRLKGEWFRADQELKDFISTVETVRIKEPIKRRRKKERVANLAKLLILKYQVPTQQIATAVGASLSSVNNWRNGVAPMAHYQRKLNRLLIRLETKKEVA